MSYLSASKLTFSPKWADMNEDDRLAEQVAALDIVSKYGGEMKAQYVLWSDNCLLSIVNYPEETSAFKAELAIGRRGAFVLQAQRAVPLEDVCCRGRTKSAPSPADSEPAALPDRKRHPGDGDTEHGGSQHRYARPERGASGGGAPRPTPTATKPRRRRNTRARRRPSSRSARVGGGGGCRRRWRRHGIKPFSAAPACHDVRLRRRVAPATGRSPCRPPASRWPCAPRP